MPPFAFPKDPQLWIPEKTPRKHNVIFLNLHGNCNRSDPKDRLETVRISSVLSFGALMVSEPTNDAETESFKVGVMEAPLTIQWL